MQTKTPTPGRFTVEPFGTIGFVIQDREALSLKDYLGRGNKWTEGVDALVMTKENAEKRLSKLLKAQGEQ